MSNKLIYAILFSVVVSTSSLIGYSYASYETNVQEKRVTEILDIYQTHMLKQLSQTDNWVGLEAMSQLRMDIDILKVTESKESNAIELVRQLVWLKLSMSIEEQEQICEIKTYPKSKEHCTKQLDKAHYYLEKYAHYKDQI